MSINDDVGLDKAAPVEQKDAPSLKEALEVYPNDGTCPLAIAEYRALQQKKTKTKKKRSGKRIQLLRHRRLAKELVPTPETPGKAAIHNSELAKIESQVT